MHQEIGADSGQTEGRPAVGMRPRPSAAGGAAFQRSRNDTGLLTRPDRERRGF